MLLVIPIYLTFVGVTLLALAVAKHHRQAFDRAPSKARAMGLRVAGALTLMVAAALWARDRGLDMGLVSWVLWLLPSLSIGVVIGLAYAPRLVARSALIGLFERSNNAR